MVQFEVTEFFGVSYRKTGKTRQELYTITETIKIHNFTTALATMLAFREKAHAAN